MNETVTATPIVWALKGPSKNNYGTEYNKVVEFLSDSIRHGTSRFGWSWINTADLKVLQNKQWKEMSKDEQDVWSKTRFLLDIKKGDWVVHINLPRWGYCFAGQIIDEYSFEKPDKNVAGDYGHTLKLDPISLVEFNRNDVHVHPLIASRLKLQGSHWQIRFLDEFLQTIQNLKTQPQDKKVTKNKGVLYLKQDLDPSLKQITKTIQKCHPGGDLETLLAEVFRNIPGVDKVIENGKIKGRGTDHGADLIVEFKPVLSFGNLEKQEKLVVQVKSYEGQHWETNAVNQIEDALAEFNATAGLIVTTAETTPQLEEAIENLNDKLDKAKKPITVGLIAGKDVAKFVLKYGAELIL